MPFDENGVKWSCEPCIRGHRSSKCAHYDRLMVSVGKAGRPLSKCPHVEGSCNCKRLGAFMVAIPKGSSCYCRPVYKMILGQNGTTPAPLDMIAAPSASASSASPSPNKIQKSSKKHVKTAPEQVTRALQTIPEFHQNALQYGSSPLMNPYTPQALTPGYPYNATGTLTHPNTFPLTNDFSNGLGLATSGFAAGAFHSNSFQSPVQPEAHMQTSGSCCSKSRRESPSGIKAEPNIVAPNPYTVSPLATSPVAEASASTWQGFSNIDGHFSSVDPTPNGFHTGFASHTSPTNHASIGFEQVPMAQPELAAALELTNPGLTNHTSGVPHSCNCGPECNCFACPDHPYNDITVQHVQEMGRIIAQDSQILRNGSQQENTQANGLGSSESQMSQTLAEPENDLQNNLDPMPAGSCCSTDNGPSDGDPHTQALESFTTDHLMVPDAYYTYEYQVGLPGACAGEAGNCQCGPSCSCLGCLTHGNI
ncbi:putative copper-activated transcription factor GRISEA [Aspergillus mulundensis]|uniref:Copper-fist domain-containing protein n=1 Tax=Aspergillus mulundensis TaxID=1810919 RepID=A0A3D8SU60_9EURO|nr:hypothetical protein DSM5745_01635 [Aspergillus mulundensis]RDW89860.1 hypothetical protein DSM5745_01635 [Aspergillus mulundensis]